MHFIAVFDIVSFLASLTALIVLLSGWKRVLGHDAKLFFVVILLLTIFYNFCLARVVGYYQSLRSLGGPCRSIVANVVGLLFLCLSAGNVCR